MFGGLTSAEGMVGFGSAVLRRLRNEQDDGDPPMTELASRLERTSAARSRFCLGFSLCLPARFGTGTIGHLGWTNSSALVIDPARSRTISCIANTTSLDPVEQTMVLPSLLRIGETGMRGMSAVLRGVELDRPEEVVVDNDNIALRGPHAGHRLVLSTAAIWSHERMLVALLPGSATALTCGGAVDHDGFYEHDAEPVPGLHFDARFLVPVSSRLSIDVTVAVRDGRRCAPVPAAAPATTAVTVSGPLVAVLEVMHGLTRR